MSKVNKQEVLIPETQSSNPGFLRKRLWTIVAIAVLSLGVLGAGLKYLEEDAKVQNALKAADRSSLSSVNPFVVSPPPPATPQLSKEFLYAGSRLLNVIDAGAQEAPPADLAIWRPSSGEWWVMANQGTQQVTQGWGINGDIPVPGDYDGDGKTDFCVFRPSNSTWYFVNSSTGATGGYTFGQSGDIPATADYDGDGKTDVAIFRPSNGTWYINRSSDGGTTIAQFGLSSDVPTPADYDGDGRADIAVWRNSDTKFYSINSSNGTLQTVPFTNSSTQPVPADYDGDGKADYAIKNGSNWVIRKSATSTFDTITWQQTGDIPVQNDYDGDGKVDIAVWRDSNGTWLIRQSSLIGQPNELRQVQWGMAGDIPVPAFYRR